MPRTPEGQCVAKKARYSDYKRLCAELGVQPQWTRWYAHYADLRGRTVRPYLSKDDLRQFWLDRFTLKEIREMAGALDSLLREDEGTTIRWEERAA